MPREKMNGVSVRRHLSVTVDQATYQELSAIKNKGESLGQVIDRLVAQRKVAQRRSIAIK